MKKVVVGVSGGVDSSTVLAMLTNQGYEVVGVTLVMQHGDVAVPHPDEIKRAQQICSDLGIRHIVKDVSQEFKQHVVDVFLDEYEVGRTPNPCILCNEYIKFAALESVRIDLSFDFIATGHYASLLFDSSNPKRAFVGQAKDPLKDQSYFLYRVSPDILGHCLFPLSNYNKDQTRATAKHLHLQSFNVKDSTGVCFAANGDYRQLVRDKRPSMLVPGPIVSTDGEILGMHNGCANYTYGQRKGLGLGGGPWFVVGIDVTTHTVTVKHAEFPLTNHLKLYNPVVWCDLPLQGAFFDVQTRYHLPLQKAFVTPQQDSNATTFLNIDLCDSHEVFACPGQSCVLLRDGFVYGGGFIA